MRCHYEVLNVSKEADETEIKSSYRKLALKWHPDKNLDDPDTAKEQFQFVQQAYEVLSDKQERAWYDKHREQILHGANSDFADKSLDVFQYFTTSCFNDYSDSENGFYTVYRNVFEQIAKEDLEYYENKDDFLNIPTFGTSESDYDSIVNPFYSYWMSYSTKKSYVWLDPHSINDVKDRRYVKAAEKENKKVRTKAKKERNEEIRNLVAFVRKRDKRVKAWIKINAAKIETNRKKQEELRRQKLEENRKMNESQVQAEWTKFENMSSQLQEIEKDLNKEFGDSDMTDEEYSDLYCPACNKLFKTEKSFQNHESSKKHKENVAALREQLLAEDGDENSIEEKDQNGIEDKDGNVIEGEHENGTEEKNENGIEDVGNSVENNDGEMDSDISSSKLAALKGDTEELSRENYYFRKKQYHEYARTQQYLSLSSDSEEILTNSSQKKPNRSKKNKKVLKVESTDDELKMSTHPQSSSSEDFSSTKKGKKKNRKKKAKKAQDNVDIVPMARDKAKFISALQKKEDTLPTVQDEDTFPLLWEHEPVPPEALNCKEFISSLAKEYKCCTCSKIYHSKNKLFDHLKAENHAAAIVSSLVTDDMRGKGKRKGAKK